MAEGSGCNLSEAGLSIGADNRTGAKAHIEGVAIRTAKAVRFHVDASGGVAYALYLSG